MNLATRLLFIHTFVTLWIVSGPSFAADPELATDRPGQTESSSTVPPGYVQIETGWSYAREDEGGVRVETSGIPATLARIGLFERAELRVVWAGFVSQEITAAGPNGKADGIGDTGIGAKLLIWDEKECRPETALLFGISLPTGDDEVSSDRADPAFRIASSHTLSDRLSLGYNAGMAWGTGTDGGNRSTLSHYVYTTTLGISLSDRFGTYVEIFGEIPASEGGAPRNSVDAGASYRLRDNLQLDASVGLGLSNQADDWFVGGGLSVRLPD